MQFNKLKLRNFMSFRKADIDLSCEGLFIVEGKVLDSDFFSSNGAGKSTLFEAITWVLFGKVIKEISADDVVNDKAKRNCLVSLSFTIGKNKYKIIRGRKHKTYSNGLLIKINGKPKSEASTALTQEFINNTIGFDFQSFTNSVIFGQGNIVRFSTATDAGRKEILEELLGLQYIPKAQQSVKAKYNTLSDQLNILKHNRGTDVDTLQHMLETMHELRDSRDEFIFKKYEVMQNIIHDIQLLDIDIANLEIKVIPHLDDVIGDSTQRSNKNEKKVELLKGKQHNINYNPEKLYSVDHDLHFKTRELAEVSENIMKLKRNKKCNKCGNKIPLAKYTKMMDDLQQKEEEYKYIVIEELQEKLDKLKTKRTKFDKINQEIELLNNMDKKSVDEWNQLQLSKTRITQNHSSLDSLNFRRLIGVRDLVQYAKEKYIGGEHLTKVEKQVERQETLVKEKDAKIKELESELKYYQFWVEGFSNSGIKAAVVDTVLPFLNERASRYLSLLAGEGMLVKFGKKELKDGTVRDKLAVTCKRVNGGKNYGGISGGEKKRIDISQALALRDLVSSRGNNSANFIFLDEVFESIDPKGIDRVLELLNELASNNKTIYVATHLPGLKDYFPGSITVINREGESKIG